LASLQRPPPGPVSIPGLGLPTYRPLHRVQSRFILPCRRAPSEFLRFNSRATPFGERSPAKGPFPSSRHDRGASTYLAFRPEELPAQSAGSATTPPFVPPSGFLSLSAAYSAPRLHGLVSSRSHVQGSSRSGASPSAQPPSLSRGSAPLPLFHQTLAARGQRPPLGTSASRP
jgi:hypothetical protein